MEPLVEIPREKWAELRDLYTKNWPDRAEAYILLNIQIAYPKLNQEFDFHVYCPEGKLANGMIATFEKEKTYQVIIQPIGDNIAKIEESLVTTNIIDWNKPPMVPYANAITIECLERVKEQLGVKFWYNAETKAYKHFLDKGSKKFDDLVIPPNTYIGLLQAKDIDIVNKTWAFHGENTHKIFESLIKAGLSYVLYSKNETGRSEKIKEEGGKKGKAKSGENKDANEESIEKENNDKKIEILDEPLAWLSVGESGALSHLFCSEKHRRKGYSEILTKYVINELLSKGLNTIAYTLESNINPKNLFRKLGFIDIGYDYWVIVIKKS